MLRVQEVALPCPCMLPSHSPAAPHFLLVRDVRKTIHCYCVCPITRQNPRACLATSCPAQPFSTSSTQAGSASVPDPSTWAGPPIASCLTSTFSVSEAEAEQDRPIQS